MATKVIYAFICVVVLLSTMLIGWALVELNRWRTK